MIPKIIHYCWFGGKQLPPLAVFCIESWRKFCPDFRIMRWDESNFDVSSNAYVREAYSCKKWAFVTDYVRLKVLAEYGGVYMDTDVQLVSGIDDFLDFEAFSGFEGNGYVPTGLMASVKRHPMVCELLSAYKTRHFLLNDGSMDFTTNTYEITQFFKNRGLVPSNARQTICGFTFFPREYFCPKDYLSRRFVLSDKTVAIHHFSGSWLDKDKTVDDVFLEFFRKFEWRKAEKKCNRYVARKDLHKKVSAFLSRFKPRRFVAGLARRFKRLRNRYRH